MQIARDLQRELLAGNRYRVLLTLSTDSFVALRERVARAQAARADLFLSLHADAHGDSDVRGASVYTLSEEASDREAAALAARMSAIADGGFQARGLRLDFGAGKYQAKIAPGRKKRAVTAGHPGSQSCPYKGLAASS